MCGDADKSVFREKFIALSAYIIKKRSNIKKLGKNSKVNPKYILKTLLIIIFKSYVK